VRAVELDSHGPPSVLIVRDRPDPEPGPGQVLVDVLAAGVNFPDILVVAGTYQVLPPLPFSPGKEVSGTVTALGQGVDDPALAVGARVVAQVESGGYVERLVVPAAQVVPVPTGVDLVEAAALGLVGLTAWFGLGRRARAQPGETVLVTGAAGGVGLAAVQVAKVLGCRVVASAVPRSGREELLRAAGADVVVGAGADLRDAVLAATDGRGADVVVETVGGPTLGAALRATAWEGRVLVVGFASGEVPSVRAGLVLVKNLALVGLQVSDYRDREPAAVREALAALLALAAQRRFVLPPAARRSLEDAAAVLTEVGGGRLSGRVVLLPEPSSRPGE